MRRFFSHLSRQRDCSRRSRRGDYQGLRSSHGRSSGKQQWGRLRYGSWRLRGGRQGHGKLGDGRQGHGKRGNGRRRHGRRGNGRLGCGRRRRGTISRNRRPIDDITSSRVRIEDLLPIIQKGRKLGRRPSRNESLRTWSDRPYGLKGRGQQGGRTISTRLQYLRHG